MTEQVVVKSAQQYFVEYGRDGIGKGADKFMIRRQLIDAFHKEIFGLVAMRTKNPTEGDPEAIRVIKNVVRDTQRKWIKLCRMFAMYNETRGLLKEDDLRMDEDEVLQNASLGNVAEVSIE